MKPIDYGRAAEVTETLQQRLVSGITGDTGAGVDVSRRSVLGGIGALGAGALAATGPSAAGAGEHSGGGSGEFPDEHGHFGPRGEFGDGFDAHEFLRTFNTGEEGQDDLTQRVYEDEQGRTVRHFQLTAVDTTVEVAPGVEFAAWAYHDQVPGPTLRAEEGDIIEVEFRNAGEHAHTIHPHLKNLDPAMDGTPQNGPGVIDAEDGSFTYRWIAQPAGVHLYHCHSLPLKDHIHRGLYGAMIVDPDPERVRENPEEYVTGRQPIDSDGEYADRLVERAKSLNHTYPENDAVDEMVMVMNGFDTNFDGDNEIYAVNTRAFAYGVGETDGEGNWAPGETIRPIQVDGTDPVRVYLVNAIEFDPINSFHTHSQFFDYYDHGTTLEPTHATVDTVLQTQAQRGIIELDYSDHDPGLYMFHAHQSEFAELGWMSFFEVV